MPLIAALLVGLTSGAVLVLEIVATRLVAPYVGLTLETTSAAIGVALAGIAAGAAYGGRLADRLDPRLWLGPVIAVGGLLVLSARPIVLALGDRVGVGPFGTLVLVTLAVGPAAFALTTVTPGVIKLRLHSLSETGTTVGGLSAAGTLGALAGTFLTGFVLIQALSISSILLSIGIALVLLGLVVALTLGRSRSLVVPVVLLGLVGGTLVAAAPGPCLRETRYFCAEVLADEQNPEGRRLVLDGITHSYVDLADPTHLDLSYTQRIGDVLDSRPPGALTALHLGLAGGTVPRYLAATRPGSQSLALEVDPELVDLGRDLLGLDDIPDLRVEIGDARVALRDEPTGAYDVVVGDAFGGLAVPWHLTTREFTAQIRRVLSEDGVYVLNVIDRPPLSFAEAQTATLRAVFDDVLLLATPEQARGQVGGNFVLVAGRDLDREALRAAGRGGEPYEVLETAEFAGDADVLTDDHAPVDQLLTPYSR